MQNNGLFITFEGGEGSGKSCQAERLCRHLHLAGYQAIRTREPGGTMLGEEVREMLLKSTSAISPMAELMLFNAARGQLVAEVIKPALDTNQIVVSDRFFDSTIAYQGYGRGLSIKTVTGVCEAACQGVLPNLTFLLDVPVEIGLARKAEKLDRIEAEGMAFLNAARDGFFKLAGDQPGRWVIIDATKSKDEVESLIRQQVYGRIYTQNR